MPFPSRMRCRGVLLMVFSVFLVLISRRDAMGAWTRQVGRSRPLPLRHDSSLNIHVAVTASLRPTCLRRISIERRPLECREGRYGWASAIESTRFVQEWNTLIASAPEPPNSKLRIAIECSRSGASDATARRRPLDGQNSHWSRIRSPHLLRNRPVPSAE